MKILVTGGTGGVGSRLLPRLAAAGHDCRVLVRDRRKVTLPDGMEPVDGDLLQSDSLGRALDGIAAIVHLAALLRSPDEKAIWRVNLDGTRSLIAATKAHAPQALLIMASTSLVYPDDLSHPAREDDDVAPAAAYPASKVAAERELLASGLTNSILRLGYVYGDGDQHLANAPRLFALWQWHPAQVLRLIHQRDVAAAVERALTGAMNGRLVNIVDNAPITAHEISALVGTPLDPSNAPLPNPWAGHLDGSLARSLGFIPTIPTVYDAIRSAAI